MNMWQMWLLVKLDTMCDALISIGALGTLLATAALILLISILPNRGRGEGILKAVKVLLPVFVFMLLFGLCMPNTKQAAVIWAAPKILESSVVKEDIPELYNLAVDWMKDQLNYHPQD